MFCYRGKGNIRVWGGGGGGTRLMLVGILAARTKKFENVVKRSIQTPSVPTLAGGDSTPTPGEYTIWNY